MRRTRALDRLLAAFRASLGEIMVFLMVTAIVSDQIAGLRWRCKALPPAAAATALAERRDGAIADGP